MWKKYDAKFFSLNFIYLANIWKRDILVNYEIGMRRTNEKQECHSIVDNVISTFEYVNIHINTSNLGFSSF